MELIVSAFIGTFMCQNFVYVFKHNRIKKTLETQVEELGDLANRLQRRVDDAISNGEHIEADVEKWLTRVDKITVKVKSFFEDEVKVDRMRLCGNCPNPLLLYSLNKKADKLIGDVNHLIRKGSFETVSYLPAPPSLVDEVAVPQELCRCFKATKIRTATTNFNHNRILGTGGFSVVFEGFIDGIQVAIKRLNPTQMTPQGREDFWAEIKMLSRLHHRNLLSLIGYCNEEGEMILVFDYMPNGTLRQHLCQTDTNPPLSWKQRLEICIGVARGLNYLHEGAEQYAIIHRDVKTTNILLDKNYVAKVSDFGLSKIRSESRSHVTTIVKGTSGYIDMEYSQSKHLTEKSDVFAFGVVLFEVLCGRAAVDKKLEKEQHDLVQWVRHCVKNRTLDQIIDQSLLGKIAPECLRVFKEIAVKCICEGRNERPKMSEAVWSLESALKLQLQEGGDAENGGINNIGGVLGEEIEEEDVHEM